MINRVSLEGLSLHVTDVEQSIAFYTRIPGAEVLQHRPGQFGIAPNLEERGREIC